MPERVLLEVVLYRCQITFAQREVSTQTEAHGPGTTPEILILYRTFLTICNYGTASILTLSLKNINE